MSRPVSSPLTGIFLTCAKLQTPFLLDSNGDGEEGKVLREAGDLWDLPPTAWKKKE